MLVRACKIFVAALSFSLLRACLRGILLDRQEILLFLLLQRTSDLQSDILAMLLGLSKRQRAASRVLPAPLPSEYRPGFLACLGKLRR